MLHTCAHTHIYIYRNVCNVENWQTYANNCERILAHTHTNKKVDKRAENRNNHVDQEFNKHLTSFCYLSYLSFHQILAQNSGQAPIKEQVNGCTGP